MPKGMGYGGKSKGGKKGKPFAGDGTENVQQFKNGTSGGKG